MFLIDGYNLLHVLTRGPAGAAARERLLGLLEDFCGRGGYRARIVFDPTGELPRRSHRGDVEIRTVEQGRDADGEIMETLRGTGDRTAYTVVTSDREIVREAERLGFEVVRSGEFVRKLLARPEAGPDKSDAVPPGDVDYWMREFGLDDPTDPH